jgi:hypothetical protein
MNGQRKNPIDALLVLVRASLGDRRRSPVRLVLAVLLLVLLLGLPIYLLWPTAERPLLLLAAFDQVALPGETVPLCARIEPLGEAEPRANLAGCRLYFQELQSDWRQELATDHDGKVIVPMSPTRQRGSPSPAHQAPADLPLEIVVRYPGEGPRQPGTQSRSHVFVWPLESSLLLVDAERALPDEDPAKLWTANNLDIRPRSGAVACLRAIRAKYRIGYLSAGADRPSRYNKLRAWLERSWAPEPDQFPDGPLLARACHLSLSETEFLQATLKDLKERFQGPAVALTAHAENARLFHQAGWRSFLLSETTDSPEGVTVVPSWSELNRRLP